MPNKLIERQFLSLCFFNSRIFPQIFADVERGFSQIFFECKLVMK